MTMHVTYQCHHARAALGVGNNMVDDGAKLGVLLFDVGPSFSDGLLCAIDAHLVWLVKLSLMLILDHLAPVHLALLMGIVYAGMAGCEPRIAQTFVLVVGEAYGPVAPPFFLASPTRVRSGPNPPHRH
jgi:hypothetical protein